MSTERYPPVIPASKPLHSYTHKTNSRRFIHLEQPGNAKLGGNDFFVKLVTRKVPRLHHSVDTSDQRMFSGAPLYCDVLLLGAKVRSHLKFQVAKRLRRRV